MSYAFLSKVYPDLKPTQKSIYDDKLYQDLSHVNPMSIKKPDSNKPQLNRQYEGLENTITNNDTNLANNDISQTSPDYAQMLLHLDYVLKNDLCKEILMKKLNIGNPNLLSEDVIELIGFILFGILVVFILDRMRV